MSVVFLTGNTLQQKLENDQKLSGRIINSLESWHNRRKKNGSIDKFTINGGGNTNTVVIPPVEFFNHNGNIHYNDAGFIPGYDDDGNVINITAKLFLPRNTNSESAGIAVKQALDLIVSKSSTKAKVSSIKNFIVSIEGLSFSSDHPCEQNGNSGFSSDDIADIWKEVTKVGSSYDNLIEQYGIAELSAERLNDLLSVLDNDNDNNGSQQVIFPSIDHINASDCCALPPGLLATAKTRGIRLLAHHDPDEMLPECSLQKVINQYSTDPIVINSKYSWNWILRLTYIEHDRQVLTGNEYLVSVSSS